MENSPSMILSDFLKQGSVISLPNGNLLLAWGKGQRDLKPSEKAPSFFVTDFFLKNRKPWVTFDAHAVLSPREFAVFLGECAPHPPNQWHNPFQTFFEEAFQELQFLFKQKGLKKAVPYVYEYAPSLPLLQTNLLSALTQMEKGSLYLYGMWTENEGVLGLTPEHLFRKTEGRLHTVALAGTGTPLDVWNEKNKKEHQIVIDGITESLKPFGAISSEPTRQIDLPILSHLATPLCLHAEISFESAVRALHPTPALGAAPTGVGSKWLKAYNQRVPRFYYGAPWGIRYNQEECCYVAIRNMQWSRAGTFLAAGCGVVPESNCGAEWAEIEVKLKAIKKGLGI